MAKNENKKCPQCGEESLVTVESHSWPRIDPQSGKPVITSHKLIRCENTDCPYKLDECLEVKTRILLSVFIVMYTLDEDGQESPLFG